MSKNNEQEIRRHVLCIKWGTRYPSLYANHLYRQVAKHLTPPFQFHCLTDDPTGLDDGINILLIPNEELHIRGWWQKVSMFKRDFHGLEGTLLFIDLDMLILSNLDDFFSYRPGKFVMVENWFKNKPPSSCLMRIEIGQHADVYDSFQNNAAQIMNIYSKGGDQHYISDRLKSVLCYWPDGWVLNYKKACRHRLPLWCQVLPECLRQWISHQFNLFTEEPTEGKVLAFQCKPDIHEILTTSSGRYRASPWLQKYWLQKS